MQQEGEPWINGSTAWQHSLRCREEWLRNENLDGMCRVEQFVQVHGFAAHNHLRRQSSDADACDEFLALIKYRDRQRRQADGDIVDRQFPATFANERETSQ